MLRGVTPIARVAAAAALAAGLLGCSPPAFKSVDITGADYARGFTLESATGGQRSLQDFRGKVTVVFFGFTQCPDVCPTTLSDLAEVRRRLGPAGNDVQVVFITLDPERDSSQVLAQYVPGFDSSFVALRGSPEQIASVAKEFKVFYQKVAGKTPSSYTLDHTAGAYVFDRDGRIRLYIRHGTAVDDLAADLRRLL